MTGFLATALEKIQLERHWLTELFNYPISDENMATLSSIFSCIDKQEKIPEEQRELATMFLQNLSNHIVDLCLFSSFGEVEVSRLTPIVLIFYNYAAMIEKKELQDRFQFIQKLLDKKLSLMETLEIMQRIAQQLAPLLATPSSEISANRLFLDKLDKFYSDLREESKQ